MTLSDNEILLAVIGFLIRLGGAFLIYFIARWLARRARTWLHVSLQS
jgi:hypothetical protein